MTISSRRMLRSQTYASDFAVEKHAREESYTRCFVVELHFKYTECDRIVEDTRNHLRKAPGDHPVVAILK